jgi:hypothetical protein
MVFTLHANDPNRPNVLANAIKFLGSLPMEKAWDIQIGPHKKTRSPRQNAALFGCAYPAIREQTGEDDMDRLHEHFCCLHFGVAETGLGYQKPRRTTTRNEQGQRDVISTMEMAAFYSRVQRECAQFGVWVPDPDPMYKHADGGLA